MVTVFIGNDNRISGKSLDFVWELSGLVMYTGASEKPS